jgi:hypothetical protein
MNLSTSFQKKERKYKMLFVVGSDWMDTILIKTTNDFFSQMKHKTK